MNFHPELDDPRVTSAGNGTETGCAENDIRVTERWGIGHFEGLGPKFQIKPLKQNGPFDKVKIEIPVGQPTNRIARTRSECELWRDGEGRGFEVTPHAFLGFGQRRIPDPVWTLGTESGEGVEIRGLGDGKWKFELQVDDGGNLPAAEQTPSDAGQVSTLSIARQSHILKIA